MKKILLGVAAAAMTLVGASASAQPYGGYRDAYRGGYDSDGDGRSDRREWNRDRDRDGRPDQWDRYDRRHGAYSRYDRGHRWRHGQVYPYYRQRGYVIDNYRAYRLPPPRAGYRYYRSDNGDVVMAAIATGVIAMILSGALDGHDGHGRYDGYNYGGGYRPY